MGDPRGSLPVKVAALFVAVITLMTATFSAMLLVVAYREGYYQEETIDTYADTETARSTALTLCANVLADPAFDLAEYGNQLAVTITDSSGQTVRQQGAVDQIESTFRLTVTLREEDTEIAGLPAGTYQAALFVGAFSAGAANPFQSVRQFFNTVYPLRRALPPAALLSLLLCLICLVFLFCAAGHRRGTEAITANVQDRIPLDLYLAADIFLLSFLSLLLDGLLYNGDLALTLTLYALAYFLLIVILLALLMTLATRLKLGRFWENTLCWQILRLAWRLLRGFGREVRRLLHLLPMTWRTVLLTAALLFLQGFLFFWGCWDRISAPILLMLAMDVAVLAAVVYISWNLQRLKEAGQDLAEGHLDAKVDTSRMLWDLRQHGEHLNAIGEGMNRAVDQRMRSERLKTELITNVSHDIKTPLTSIVNYVDLLKKEELPEQAAGYVAVLDRQSRRLKKLTEDLVEASKASTGNIKVQLQPIVVNEIINQAVGDYDRRLADGKLEVIINTFEGSLTALADGRLLWRVLDNLLSNVCKYAMAGSRVYIDLTARDGRVVLSMKNVSRDRLNISADELMERFVRGDASRHTEGSGLGLNIAKSLMELMGGTFSLAVDGDLFKAELTLKGTPEVGPPIP